MNDFVNIFFDNLDTIVDSCIKILDVVGGCAIFSAIFPKGIGKLDASKGKFYVANAKKLVNLLITIYNLVVTTANVGGFNFGKAKNAEEPKE